MSQRFPGSGSNAVVARSASTGTAVSVRSSTAGSNTSGRRLPAFTLEDLINGAITFNGIDIQYQGLHVTNEGLDVTPTPPTEDGQSMDFSEGRNSSYVTLI